MSAENVDTVRAMYAAYARGDFATGLACLDPDIEFSQPEDEPGGGTYHGHEGVIHAFAKWTGAWNDYRVEVDELSDLGADVLARTRHFGRGKDSGVEVEMQIFQLWTLHNGKVVRARMYYDEADARAASSAVRSNAEVLRRFLIEQFYDIDVFITAMKRGEVEIFDPGIVYEDAELPDHVGEIYSGYERVLHSAETWREGGGHMTLELSEIVGRDDELVSIHTLHVKADHAGVDLDGPVAYHWTFRNGKVVHLRAYRVPEEALAAAGLRAGDSEVSDGT